MNPDNPYAVPQTQFEITPELPLAEAVEPVRRRIRFQQLDTLELCRLTDFSNSLRYMRLLWLIVLASSVGIAIVLFYRQAYFSGGSVLIIVVPLLAGRIYADDLRSEQARHYSQFVDFLACLGIICAALVGGGFLLWQGIDGIGQCLVWLGFLFMIGIFPLSSFLAHYCAAELFGPQRYSQRDLLEEYNYRTRFHIP